MFELASALFSIADANEFRFARFYIVCEEALLALLKSPPIVCGCRTSFADCQNVERHGIRYQTRHRRNIPILLQRIPAAGWQSGTVQVQIFLNLCLPHSMPGLLASPLAGRHARDAAEEPCEIVDVGDAAGCRNILHGNHTFLL